MKTANFPRSAIIETYGRFPFHCDEEDWLISIADRDAYNAPAKARFGRILYLNFNDVDLNTPGSIETPKAMATLAQLGAITNAQAEQIAEFIKEAMAQKKNVWVNCHAGMCRSGAVVRLLGELGWEIDDKHSPERIPNILVYNKIRKHFPQLQQTWD
jgi:predicted protein tyrosine phosphatase